MNAARAGAATTRDDGEAEHVSGGAQEVEERPAEASGPEASGTEASGPEASGPEKRATRSRRWRGLAAGVLAVALIAAGTAMFVRGQQMRDTPATANRALTDTAATDRVTGDVSSALATVFSYAPGTTAATKTAARRLLAARALQQYAALFGQVEKQAADQELTLTTHVVRAGVTRLTGDSAHLLVFLDQVYEREGKTATTAAAQLSVTARQQHGVWQIVDITSR
ncbi:hypothetical protein OG233_03185 [Streptomyces sp. NBC_01218]|uniref:hypothetical protein n=1 Tax=Streptomyces sp. NBC_01218 TaxID=2903780 RepID=UPI002E0FF37B|nr:hypothetical protein OG233_03185 [Streptomyces sp. NBC_01218]